MAKSSKNNRSKDEKKQAMKAKKQNGGKSTAPASAPQKDERKMAKKAANRRKFALEVMPFIWGALAVILLACLMCQLIGQPQSASEHWMGPVSYVICYALLGVFGWSAYVLPFVLAYFANNINANFAIRESL